MIPQFAKLFNRKSSYLDKYHRVKGKRLYQLFSRVVEMKICRL